MFSQLHKQLPHQQLTAFLLIWLFFYIAGTTVAALIMSAAGITLEDSLAQQALKPNQINLLRIMQSLLSVFLFGLPVIYFLHKVKEPLSHSLGLVFWPSTFAMLVLVFVVWVAAPFMFSLVEINQKIEFSGPFQSWGQFLRESANDQEKFLMALLQFQNMGEFFLVFAMVALLPAVFEEWMFRGILQQWFLRATGMPHLSIIVSALFFSAIHFHFDGFLARLFLGLIFGYVFAWSGTLWYPMLAHFVHNATQLFWYSFARMNIVPIDPDSIEKVPFVLSISSILLLWALMMLLRTLLLKKHVGQQLGQDL